MAKRTFPWGEFLHVRTLLLLSMRDEGRSYFDMADQVSCPPDQIARILGSSLIEDPGTSPNYSISEIPVWEFGPHDPETPEHAGHMLLAKLDEPHRLSTWAFLFRKLILVKKIGPRKFDELIDSHIEKYRIKYETTSDERLRSLRTPASLKNGMREEASNRQMTWESFNEWMEVLNYPIRCDMVHFQQGLYVMKEDHWDIYQV